MLDGVVRRKIDPVLNTAGKVLAGVGITPNSVTVFAWLLGLAAAGSIAMQSYWLGLVFIASSRIADGLDGAVAKATKTTDFGGYLDIVLDFFFYGAIPLAFIIAEPAQNAIAGAVLIFSFYFNGATFLAYSALAERHRITTDIRGMKSIYFTTGLAEATETIAVFVIFCLFPAYFPVVAYGFAALCFLTSASRIYLARKMFP